MNIFNGQEIKIKEFTCDSLFSYNDWIYESRNLVKMS